MNDDATMAQAWKDSMSYLPRSITFLEVRVGDTIRAKKSTGIVRVVQGEVTQASPYHLEMDGSYRIFIGEGWSLKLIDRPEPDRPSAKPVPCPFVRGTWPIVEHCILPAGHDDRHCDGAGRRFEILTQPVPSR